MTRNMKLSGLEKKLQAVCNDFVEQKLQQITTDVTNDRYKVLKDICTELDHTCISNAEHERLLANATKSKEQVDADIEKRVAQKAEVLQKQLEHELDKTQLVHAVKLAQLTEEIKHLRSITAPPVAVPVAVEAPAAAE